MRFTVLVTRPLPDALTTAALLKARGIEAMVAPMLSIHVLTEQRAAIQAALAAGVQAVIVTSSNGARALGQLIGERDMPVVAVGEATAAALRDEWFTQVHTAGGDSGRLLEYVERHFTMTEGVILYTSAADIASDLPAALAAKGFHVEHSVIYRAETMPTLPPEVVYALQQQHLQGVLFYSARTAAVFREMVRRYDLNTALLDAYCLSNNVAVALQGSVWHAVHVAPEPTQEALLGVVACK